MLLLLLLLLLLSTFICVDQVELRFETTNGAGAGGATAVAFLSTIRHGEDERALDERGRSCFPSELVSISTYRGGPFLAKPSDGPEDMEQEGAAIADNFSSTCIITFRSSATHSNDSQCPVGSSHAILRPNQPSPYDRE